MSERLHPRHRQSRRRKLTRFPVLAMTVILAMILVACSPGDDASDDPGEAAEADPSDEQDPEGEPADDGEEDTDLSLVVAIPDEFPTLGFDWGYQAQTGLLLNNIHETLVDRHPETNELIPALATDWELIDDLTWHFTIREGVFFHDGSELTAEVAADALNWAMDEENNFVIRGNLEVIPEGRALDRMTLEISTPQPKPTLPARLATIGLGSMQAVEESPETYEENPVGTGPYQFVEWNRGESYVLERFDDWWGANDDSYPGEQYWDDITFLVRPEVSSRVSSVLADEVDFAWDLPADECQAALGEQCARSPSPTVTNYRVDPMSEVLGDLRVREAMSIAIDREAIGEQILGGAEPATQLNRDSMPGFNPDIEVHPYDPERARELIEEAAADGVPVDAPKTLYGRLASFAGDSEVLEILLETWTSIGLTNWEAEMLDTPAYNEILLIPAEDVSEERNLVLLLRNINDVFDMSRAYNFHVCGGAISLVCDPEVDAIIEEASGTFDPEERAALHSEVAVDLFAGFDRDWFVLNEVDVFHGVSERIDFQGRQDMRLRVKDIAPR